MSKKNQSKKHKFKHVEASQSQTSVSASSTQDVSEAPVSTAPRSTAARTTAARMAPAVVGRDFSYVAGDLRRIVIFAVVLFVLELVLWLVFSRTAVGPAVYGLVHV